MQGETKKPSKAIVAIIVVVLLAAAAAGAMYMVNSNKVTDSDAPATTDQTTTETPSSDTTATEFKDGTYNATGDYISPGGQESIDVELTLAGNKITSATVTPHPAASTSVQYQTEFANNFKPLVVGKSINEVNLSRVAGSSLTSGGFNDALDQIKTDAAV